MQELHTERIMGNSCLSLRPLIFIF